MELKLRVPKMKVGEQSVEILSLVITMEQDADGVPVFVGKLKMSGGFD